MFLCSNPCLLFASVGRNDCGAPCAAVLLICTCVELPVSLASNMLLLTMVRSVDSRNSALFWRISSTKKSHFLKAAGTNLQPSFHNFLIWCHQDLLLCFKSTLALCCTAKFASMTPLPPRPLAVYVSAAFCSISSQPPFHPMLWELRWTSLQCFSQR